MANKKILIKSFLVGFITQIPNLLLITTPAFWIKNGQFNFKYIYNFLVYLSPKTMFFQNPDIDLQHVIPKISIMYDWMIIPYFVGLYILFRKIKNTSFKFIALYAVTVLTPAVFTGYFYSTQRSLTFVVPLTIIIGLGIDEIFVHLNPKNCYPLVNWGLSLLYYNSLQFLLRIISKGVSCCLELWV